MTNNDLLRSLRFLLNLREVAVVELLESAGYFATTEEVAAYVKREDEVGYDACPDEVVAYFLNGMVTLKRGKDLSRPAPPIELPLLNNDVLKKLRVAFQLKDTDVLAKIESASGLKVTKSELSAFFRARDHANFRECGDQYLRALLKALA